MILNFIKLCPAPPKSRAGLGRAPPLLPTELSRFRPEGEWDHLWARASTTSSIPSLTVREGSPVPLAMMLKINTLPFRL